MRLSNGFVIDKEKTFGELKFTAVRDVFLQNEDGTPSTQLKKRIDRKSTRLNSSHSRRSRMPSSA